MPTKEKFYSSLTGKEISDNVHLVKVWERFEMKTMKYNHNLYLKFDVLLLSDMFEKFSNSSFKNYGLCSCYLSAPALIWDKMLNMTKVQFELISDEDTNLFLVKNV